MGPKKKNEDVQSSLTRIAVVSAELCKPKKCTLECKKCCPINMQGKLCVEVTNAKTISSISEELCIGCGLCAKRCPYGAIQIINIPSNLEKQTTHRYGANSFKLHRLPLPRAGRVLGLIGANGTGKSTALNILKGKIKPNLGRFRDEPAWEEILKYFRGSEHQAFFKHLLEDNIRTILKPQYVDQVPKHSKGTVDELLTKADERDKKQYYIDELDLKEVVDRDIGLLSGGELQRFTIAAACVQQADIYMFDEPSSYLDVRQRLKAAEIIRGVVTEKNYVIVVEHDLSVVDYMSDFVCVLYGRPSCYGVVTLPYSVREGINIFLEGFVPTENLRFREESLTFRIADDIEDVVAQKVGQYSYPYMEKQLGGFKLTVQPGGFSDSEIVVLMGENGCGKTTLIRMMAGLLKPDNGAEVPQLAVSYKPQKIAPKFKGCVRDLLQTKIHSAFSHPQFVTDVLKPLKIEDLLDQEVQALSGGELQRVGLTLALGTPANIYLIDEPSAYLDSDQRIIASRVIRRFILHAKKTAFIVEHDFIMATYLADKVITYDGKPSVDSIACTPCSLLEGMNKFLRSLEISFRRDPTNFRPRINKHGSVKDREQKESGNFFYMSEPVASDPLPVAAGAAASKKKGKKSDLSDDDE